MAWIFRIFEAKKGTGNCCLLEEKHQAFPHASSYFSKQQGGIIISLEQMRKGRFMKPEQLTPDHKLLRGRMETQIQLYSTPIPVFLLPHQTDIITRRYLNFIEWNAYKEPKWCPVHFSIRRCKEHRHAFEWRAMGNLDRGQSKQLWEQGFLTRSEPGPEWKLELRSWVNMRFRVKMFCRPQKKDLSLQGATRLALG